MQHVAIVQVDPAFNTSSVSLSDIARTLDVPVVVATYSDVGRARNYSAHGLDIAGNCSAFAAAVDQICANGAIIIPNVEGHTSLAEWSACLIEKDIRFFAGVPLLDFDGWRVGSIAVLASHKEVARKGIELRRLTELGREFAGIVQ